MYFYTKVSLAERPPSKAVMREKKPSDDFLLSPIICVNGVALSLKVLKV